MIDRIKEQVKKNPNNVFYRINDEKILYKELWNYALKYSLYLKKQGSSPVIIYGDKETFVIIAILSCLLANRAYVPVSKNTPLMRLKNIINQTKSNLIISDEKIEDLNCCKLEELKNYDIYDEKINNNDIAYIIFTSGTTGDPKGVPITKENLNNFINWISSLEYLKEQKNIKVLNQANFNFDLSVADFYYSLCNGHTLCAIENIKEYNNIFNVIKDVNLAVVTPTFMKLCMLNQEFNEINYSHLKCMYFCGERLEKGLVKKILKRFPNIKIINAYGPTEATSAISAITITKDMLDEELLPVGDMNTLATDVEIINDEIVLKGKSVSKGYLNKKSSNFYKEKNINCYKTGDIGFIKNNKLYCKERKDNQIKFKGYRIELDDIEKNILKIKEIRESVVLANFSSDNKVKSIKAIVTLKSDIEKKYIKNKLKELIPDYMIPSRIIIIDKLPMNNNGKVDRKALMEL